MKLFKFILTIISFLFHLSSMTLMHTNQYLEFLTNIKITYISDIIIKSAFFLYHIFTWLFSKIGVLRFYTYFSTGTFKEQSLVSVVQRICFRYIHRKKHRKPLRLIKITSNLNFFGDYLVCSLKLNKVFASVSTFIIYIGLLYLIFKYFNNCLKQETFKFFETNRIEVKWFVRLRDTYYKVVKLLNTISTIKIFCKSNVIYKPLINLFHFHF